MPKSTITEKMATVHFLSNALRAKILKKANGCLLKDRRKAGSRFVYSAKISHHWAILCHLFSNLKLTLGMHPGKMLMPPSFPYSWISCFDIGLKNNTMLQRTDSLFSDRVFKYELELARQMLLL